MNVQFQYSWMDADMNSDLISVKQVTSQVTVTRV